MLKHVLEAANPSPEGGAPASGAPAPDGGGKPPEGGSPEPTPQGGQPEPKGGEPKGGEPAPQAEPKEDGQPPAKSGEPAGKQTAPKDGGQPEGEQDAFWKSLPEDWRQQTAKALAPDEDTAKKYQNVLSRFPSFDKFAESFFEKNDLIAKGAHKQGLPDNPTEDQLTEYREANGIPATPEDYQVNLDEGLVLSDEDERIMGEVYKAAHAYNVPSKAVSDMANAMLKAREHEFDAELQQHGIDSQTATRQLKDAWGPDYETNRNLIKGWFNGLPEDVRDNVMKAEMADGRMLFNSPEFMFWAAEQARAVNPMATVLPNDSGGVESMNAEIKKIESLMREDPDAYWKDQSVQKRYEDLLEAKQKIEEQQGQR